MKMRILTRKVSLTPRDRDRRERGGKERAELGKCMFLQLLYFISHAECINSEKEEERKEVDDENACHEV